MSSLRALKRKSTLKRKDKEIISSSWPNLSKKEETSLKRSKSESDIHHTNLLKKDLKFNAKSERNLHSLYSNFTTSTPNPIESPLENSNIMQSSSYCIISDQDQIKIPIIGYEVMEERSRFTIFKLRIENYEKNNFWMVLRRFTDFTRLHTKLKTVFPDVNLTLPKKKWFGNNFSSGFLDTRIIGLQTFINSIMGNTDMRRCPFVREFFCLDDPPLYSESMEDCKAIFEAQEETIAHMKMQLKAKDELIGNLSHELHIQKNQNEYLLSLIKPPFEKTLKTGSSQNLH